MKKTGGSTTRATRPKLSDAVATLKKLVADYAIGERLPSDRTIAKNLQISNVTVSIAMQELERMGWIERISRSGSYRADVNLRRHVAIYSEMDVFHRSASRYFGRLIQHLRSGLANAGLRALPYIGMTAPEVRATECTAPWFLQDLEERRICGVIAVNVLGYQAWREHPGADEVPIVGTSPDYLCSVSTSPADFMSAAVRMLVARGCRRIAALMWDESAVKGGQPVPGSPYAAFAKTMAECGMTIRPEWVRGDIPPNLHGAGWEELREIWGAFSQKPDGLIIADDILFQDALLAFPGLGIHPGQNVDIVAQINRELEPPGNWPIILAVVDASVLAREMISCLTDWMRNGPPAAPRRIIVSPTWEFPDPDQDKAVPIKAVGHVDQ